MITLKRSKPPKSVPPQTTRFVESTVTLFVLIMLVAAVAHAQSQGAAPQQQPQDDSAPPPMRHIPDVVRKQLEESHDLKTRTRLTLEFADATLVRAAENVSAERFEQATIELGVYEALVEDLIRFVQHSGKVTNKQRDLFKRIEMTLRAHVPRLETIRRGLPAAHAVYVMTTIEFVRDQRDRALNSFYDDTVVPDAPPSKIGPLSNERATGATSSALQGEKKPDQRR